MAYTKKTWVDVPDPSNPPNIPEGQDALARFDAENMNRIEGGIESAVAHIADTTVHNQTRGGGGAIGIGATTNVYGGSIGYNATSINGGAVGSGASVENGGAIGNGARATNGGAVGYNARTSLGAAIGSNAQTVNETGNVIDAVQLGSGTNKEAKTLQVYDKKLMNADGTIPAERMPSKAPSGHGLGELTPTSYSTLQSIMQKGGGFYSVGDAEDTPYTAGDWLSVIQTVRTATADKESGAQLVFRDFSTNKPQMWFRVLSAGTAGKWVEMLHTGNTLRTQIVSYVGTGTYGVNSPCSLTFDFAPKIIKFMARSQYNNGQYEQKGYDAYLGVNDDPGLLDVIVCDLLPTVFDATHHTGLRDTPSYGSLGCCGKKSADGKTISWYSDFYAYDQFNTSGVTYYFLGIG